MAWPGVGYPDFQGLNGSITGRCGDVVVVTGSCTVDMNGAGGDFASHDATAGVLVGYGPWTHLPASPGFFGGGSGVTQTPAGGLNVGTYPATDHVHHPFASSLWSPGNLEGRAHYTGPLGVDVIVRFGIYGADGFLGEDHGSVVPGTVDISPPSIWITGLIASASLGVPYSATLVANTDWDPADIYAWNYVWSGGAGLPPGLTLNAALGTITGTPTVPGVYSVTLRATVGNPFTPLSGFYSERAYTITVPCPTIAVSIVPAAGTDFTVSAAGGTGPYTYSIVGTLPPEWSLVGATLHAPASNSSGFYSLVITATDTHGCQGSTPYGGYRRVGPRWCTARPYVFEVEEKLLTESEVGVTWVEFTDSHNDKHVWSIVPLPDPAAYFYGYKEPRIKTLGTIRRALSDDLGQYEGADFSFTLDDTDRTIRGMLNSYSTKFFPNRSIVVRSIMDSQRRALLPPRTILRGQISGYKASKNLLFDFTVRDILDSKFGSSNSSTQIPQRVISPEDFPNCTVDKVKSSAVGYKVNEPANYAIGDSTIQIDSGSGRFWPGSRVTFTGDPTKYTLSSVSGVVPTYFGSVGITKAFSISPSLTQILADNTDITEEPALEVRPAVGLPVPIVYGSISDEAVVDGIDQGDGQGPVIYVGDREIGGTTWRELLWAGHACYSTSGPIVRVYIDNEPLDLPHADLLVPGTADWTAAGFANTYVEYNGNRYTVMYAKGEVGDKAAGIVTAQDIGLSNIFSVNGFGIESIGDGTGCLIIDLLEQYLHIMQNWVLGDYRSGPWLGSPTYDDQPDLNIINETSFELASAQAADRVSGGYRGDFIIGWTGSDNDRNRLGGLSERITARELIARLNMSCDVNSGFNRRAQFFVSMVDDSAFRVVASLNINDASEIHKETLDIVDDLPHQYNVAPYRHTRDYLGRDPEGWRSVEAGELEKTDFMSIGQYGTPGRPVRLTSPMLELHMIRGFNRATDYTPYSQGTATANDVVGRFVLRHKDPPRLVSFQVGPQGQNVDLGDVVRLTHYAGIGGSGWTNRALRIIRHDANAQNYSVDITAFDLENLYNDTYILGDETVLVDWTSESNANQVYGHLSDETTGQFSDGQNGKRLR